MLCVTVEYRLLVPVIYRSASEILYRSSTFWRLYYVWAVVSLITFVLITMLAYVEVFSWTIKTEPFGRAVTWP